MKNYRYDFLKLEDTHTTVIERYEPDYIGCVFLDIFPLDYIPDDAKQREDYYTRLNEVRAAYLYRFFSLDSECHSIFEVIKLKCYRAFYNDVNLFEKWESIVSSIQKGVLVANSHDSWVDKPISEQCFGEGDFLPFEGRLYRVPKAWDFYLKHIYGDYMQLPSEKQRHGHAFDYVNYERHISDDEAQSILKVLHSKHSYKVSLKRELKNILRKLHLR